MTKNIMLQGTGSSVGKSILTSALLRIFKQEGYKVAPFKSQNMALNSFVTEDGKEMGRAQAVQAEAAGIKPTVEMNPILLKPTSDIGSQVIIEGRVYGNVSAKKYFKEKTNLKEIVLKSYNKLASRYEIIVIEGAGSCAEINLKENDIVNMGMAEMVDSPVILVADIDRGGVFASIYGTIMLLEPHERDRIKGFIINKFRGDKKILEPGIKMLEKMINKPCLGVVPYMDIKIDDEDSVTDRFKESGKGQINIGIIKLPYISNFSDFTPLELEEDVSVTYIKEKKQLKNMDMIIIPGSKNTLMDIKYIYDMGIDKEIYKAYRAGKIIIGICGGYQILGKELSDPDNVESNIKRINGLGLLDVSTTMRKNKITVQTEGTVITDRGIFEDIKNTIVSGYEIHMGETKLFNNSISAIKSKNGRNVGVINKDGKVFGTYLHGIFENDELRRSVINYLRKEKGLTETENDFSYEKVKELEYDKLASVVKENINLNAIKKILEL